MQSFLMIVLEPTKFAKKKSIKTQESFEIDILQLKIFSNTLNCSSKHFLNH